MPFDDSLVFRFLNYDLLDWTSLFLIALDGFGHGFLWPKHVEHDLALEEERSAKNGHSPPLTCDLSTFIQ
jgi:hypothetical protein